MLLVGSLRWGAPGCDSGSPRLPLKRWFQYRCDGKVVYETIGPDERGAIPINEAKVLSAADDFAVAFELNVVRQYARRWGIGCQRWA